MRILYLTGREQTYTRNQVLCNALGRLGTVDAFPDRSRGSIALRSLRAAAWGLRQLRRESYDLVFVGFYGHLIMQALRTRRTPPILFDAFVSTYDTLISDRRQAGPRSPLAWAALALDRSACRAATRVLLDTPLQQDYFQRHLGVSPNKLDWLPVGCEEAIFQPAPPPPPRERTQVLYYCTYLPLHGAERVVEAAAILREELVTFHLVGAGPLLAQTQQLARELNLSNLAFLPPLGLSELAQAIHGADICLGGHFGSSEKAGRVVPGKLYQIQASQRALVAGDTPANRAYLTEERDALFCPPQDAAALAAAIRRLHRAPLLRQQLALNGLEVFRREASEAAITARLGSIVRQMLG